MSSTIPRVTANEGGDREEDRVRRDRGGSGRDDGRTRAGRPRAGEREGASDAALIKTVKVTSKEFKFVLSAKSAKRGVVIFKVTNVGALQHDFKIKGRKTPLLSHGKSATLRSASCARATTRTSARWRGTPPRE